MTPAARIKAVIEILEAIAVSKIPMDATVGDYMRFRRYIGSKDRANIAERVYEIMRAHARLGWWLEQQNGGDLSPRARMIAWLMLGEGQSDGAVGKLFDGSKYGPEVLRDDEKALAQKLSGQTLDHKDMPDTVLAECPAEYEDSLRSYFGDDFLNEMKGMISGAPLDMRANIWRSNREDLTKSLGDDGVEVDPTPYSPWGLRAREKAFLSKTKALRKGWIEIQDEGSQLIALCCGAAPGLHVLDYCAGAGGKTLALAAAMQNKGRIVATDLEKNRLEKGRQRYKRAGVADIIEVRALAEDRNRKWLRRQKGTFDIVLTDVPCSGTGTWRRNPDMRWRNYGPTLEELIAVQAEILEKVAKTVKPGGRLVYATCSLLPAENEEQVEKFLAAHDEFEIAPLPEGIPCEKFMRLTPHRHNTDGFFAAVLQRKPE